MNLNAYDNVKDKIDKTKTWIDVNKHLLLSKEIKFRKYYILSKRYNVNKKEYDYFVILLDNIPDNKIYFNTLRDDYGRIKIKLREIFTESDLIYLDHNINVEIENVQHENDGDVWKLNI